MIQPGGGLRHRLQDVARNAGVSKSIASRVLNGDPALLVRPETRARVIEAARELNYRPHAAARGLKRSKTGALGLLVPPLTNPVYVRIIRGAFAQALELDFVVLLVEDVEPGQAEQSTSRLIQAGRVDGLMIASAQPDHPLLSSQSLQRMPHVFVNRAVAGSGRNVVMDEMSASATALDHLVALGHRRIGHVAGPRELDTARRRADGFRKHASELSLEAEVAEGDFGESGGAAAARRLLKDHPELTALYASTLSQAVGVFHAAWEMGLKLPDDLSVIAYDEMPLADYLRPPLTTIRMPLAELGGCSRCAGLPTVGGGTERRHRCREASGRRPQLYRAAAMSAITEVETIALRAAVDGEDFDSSSETLVVGLADEEGNTGIGEADAPAEAASRLVLMDDVHA